MTTGLRSWLDERPVAGQLCWDSRRTRLPNLNELAAVTSRNSGDFHLSKINEESTVLVLTQSGNSEGFSHPHKVRHGERLAISYDYQALVSELLDFVHSGIFPFRRPFSLQQGDRYSRHCISALKSIRTGIRPIDPFEAFGPHGASARSDGDHD